MAGTVYFVRQFSVGVRKTLYREMADTCKVLVFAKYLFQNFA